MTSPPIYNWGPSSQKYFDELAAFEAQRDEFYKNFMNSANAAGQVAGWQPPTGAVPFNGQTAAEQAMDFSQLGTMGAVPNGTGMAEDADLLGAARFWGIPEEVARQMPKDVLLAELNKYRYSARPAEETAMQRLQAAGTMIASMPAMAGLGVAEAITGGMGNLPVAGKYLKKLVPIHEADMWFRELEEGVRTSNPENAKYALNTAEFAGNVGAMWYPASGAWALSGKVLGGVLKGSPILRASLQGAASAGLLEGGSEHPAMAIGLGAAMGGAGTAAIPYLAAAASKVAKSFVTPTMFENAAQELIIPANRMGSASDFSKIASAAMQGDEDAILMMGQLQQSGRMPNTMQESNEIFTRMHPDPRQRDFSFTPAGSKQFYDTRNEGNIRNRGLWAEQNRQGMNRETAETVATQMNKAGTIIESPALPQIVKSTMPDELSVGFAAQSSNPGGVNVVEGVINPMEWNALGENVAFATRKGRLAALVSDQPVTPQMVSEFEQHGMFTGQRVLGPGGQEMDIQRIVGDRAHLRNSYSGSTMSVKLSQVSPSLQSPGVHDVPELWAEFNQFADQQTLQTQVAMGGALRPEQLETIKSNSMQGWMDDYLDQIGVSKLGDRARVKNYFNQKWVEGFYSTAPEQTAQNLAGQAELAEVLASHEPTPLGRVDDLAATKGYTALPNGQGGYLLVDAGLGTQPQAGAMQFDSMDAAEAFLQKVNRELPDISPNSDVPGELAGVLTREPPPEININAKFPAQVTKSVTKMANGNGGVPPVNPTEVAQANADGNFGKLNNLWKDGFMRWEPARRVFSKVSQGVRDVAGDDFGVAKIYDEMGVGLSRHHTAMAPHMNELAEVFKGVTTKRMLNGEFIDVWSIPDPQLRASMAQQMKWDKKDVAALVNFDQILSKIHGNADAPGELRGLLTYMRQQKSMGENPWTGYQVGSTTADFYEFAKGAPFGLREMDPRRLGDAYIRSVFWKKDMSEVFDAAKVQAASLKKSPQLESVGHFLDNWLDVVKNGYRPEDDIALDGIHALGRAVLGKSFSRQQARELVSLGLNTTHASFLGYRLHVMARDALQLMFAIPRAGPELAEVITRFTANPKFRQEVWNEVFQEGAVSATMPARTAPGALAGELEAAGAGQTPEGMSRRMQATGWATGMMRDIMPDFMKGSSESVLKPLYLYGKQGQMMRTLVYKSGQIKAERALETFAKTMDLDRLMAESGARTFDPAWQEEFKRLVTVDHKKAASFLGRQLADATQFKYGVAENPAVSRTVTGRMFMQMGSYQTQYLQYLRESLTNGSVTDKAKFLLTAGAVSAGLDAASKQTGWNFRYMNPYMLGFFGGPWISTATGLLQGGQAVARTLQGDGSVTPFNERAMAAGAAAAGQAAMSVNPLNGLYATATGVGSALNDSPTPGMALGRLAVTGERGALPDILNSIGIGEMVPQSNPMRMSQMALPYTPQMQPTYPSGMPVGPYSPSGANTGSGFVPSPSVTPLPGGMASGLRPNQAEDPSFIPFTANPQPGVSSGYNTDDIRMYLMEQSNGSFGRDWSKVLRPEDLKFLQSISGIPVEFGVQLFRDELRKETSAQAQTGTGRVPDGGYFDPNNPGSGGLF